MADIDWPASLPPFLQDGYEERWPDTKKRWEPDHGPALVTKYGIAGVETLALTLLCETGEANTFRNFYSVTTQGGALPFNLIHPRTGLSVEARFLGAPGLAPKEHLSVVSFQLEVLP